MKILHVSATHFAPDSVVGGGERYAMSLAKAQSELPGLEVGFLSFGDEPREYRDGPLRVRLLRPDVLVDRNIFSPFSWGLVSAIVDVDVVHAHQRLTLLAEATILAAAALHRPVFVTDLGGGTRTVAADRLAKHVTGFPCISRYSASLLPPDVGGTHVIWGGADASVFHRPPGAVRERYFLSVGRLLPHKGVNYLIEAVTSVPLKIVGRVYDERYHAELRRLAAGKPVEFVTDASDEDLRRLYCGALATVFPSVYREIYGNYYLQSELFGLVPVESMACGTPVICSAIGSLPELVEDGYNGFLVPPNDPQALRERMQWLADNPALADEMGQNALEVARTRFTWRAVAERCLTLYREAVGNGAR
jgi:glycosyltransferase involved in cell wall biosynthesis